MLLRYCFWRRPFTRSFQWRQVRHGLSCVDGEIEFCATEYPMDLPRENKSRSMSLLPALWSVSPLWKRQSPSFHPRHNQCIHFCRHSGESLSRVQNVHRRGLGSIFKKLSYYTAPGTVEGRESVQDTYVLSSQPGWFMELIIQKYFF